MSISSERIDRAAQARYPRGDQRLAAGSGYGRVRDLAGRRRQAGRAGPTPGAVAANGDRGLRRGASARRRGGASACSSGNLARTPSPHRRSRGRRLRHDLLAGGVVSEAVFPARGAKLQSHRVTGGNGAHKWVDRRGMEHPDDGAGQLICDGDELLEAGWANLFAVREETLWTPPADGRILPGTARAAILEVAGEEGIRDSGGTYPRRGPPHRRGDLPHQLDPRCRTGDRPRRRAAAGLRPAQPSPRRRPAPTLGPPGPGCSQSRRNRPETESALSLNRLNLSSNRGGAKSSPEPAPRLYPAAPQPRPAAAHPRPVRRVATIRDPRRFAGGPCRRQDPPVERSVQPPPQRPWQPPPPERSPPPRPQPASPAAPHQAPSPPLRAPPPRRPARSPPPRRSAPRAGSRSARRRAAPASPASYPVRTPR